MKGLGKKSVGWALYPKATMSPEYHLIVEIIKNAIESTMYNGTSKEKLRDKKEAITFFETPELEAFLESWHIGINADVLRRNARKLYQESK